MAIEKGNSKAMYNLAIYYKGIEKNYEKTKEYYLMAIQKGNTFAMNNIKIITTPLERYILFKKHNIPFNEEITKEIHIYNNKLKTSSKDDICEICMKDEQQKCILLNCFFHYICINCYLRLYDKPCPFCRL